MNQLEATDLDHLIRHQGALKPEVRPIGNGERIVVLDHMFLWNREDWERQKHNWAKFLYSLESL